MRPNQLSTKRRGRASGSAARASAGGAQRGPACGDTAAPFADALNLIHTNYSPNPVLARLCGRFAMHLKGLLIYRWGAAYGRF